MNNADGVWHSRSCGLDLNRRGCQPGARRCGDRDHASGSGTNVELAPPGGLPLGLDPFGACGDTRFWVFVGSSKVCAPAKPERLHPIDSRSCRPCQIDQHPRLAVDPAACRSSSFPSLRCQHARCLLTPAAGACMVLAVLMSSSAHRSDGRNQRSARQANRAGCSPRCAISGRGLRISGCRGLVAPPERLDPAVALTRLGVGLVVSPRPSAEIEGRAATLPPKPTVPEGKAAPIRWPLSINELKP